jgi:hypothetical protein
MNTWFLLQSISRKLFRLAMDDGSDVSWFRLRISVSSFSSCPISSGSFVIRLLLQERGPML